jgi:hypothetical protein
MKPLLGWNEVVEIYNKRTGENLDAASARAIASTALDKLRRLLIARGHDEETYR